MKYLIFISVLALGQCRPQVSHQGPAVEVHKQKLIELPKSTVHVRPLTNEEEAKLNATTQNILQKIAEVNLNHGLKPKVIQRPTYYSAYIPTHTHPKSIANKEISDVKTIENTETLTKSSIESKETANRKSIPKSETKAKQLPNFEFPATPFTNPIFDYLQNEKDNSFRTKSTLNPEEGEDDEKIPEGYAIKRKIIHKQTILVPNYEQFMNPNYNQMDATQMAQMMLQMGQIPQMGQQPQMGQIPQMGQLPQIVQLPQMEQMPQIGQVPQNFPQMSQPIPQMSQLAPQIAPLSPQTGQHAPQISQLASQFEKIAAEMGQLNPQTNQQLSQMSPYAPQINPYTSQMYQYAPQIGQYAQNVNPYLPQMAQYASQMNQYPSQANEFDSQMNQNGPQMGTSPKQGQYGLIVLNDNFQNLPMTNQDFGNNKRNKTKLDVITQAKQNYLINNIKSIVSNSQPGYGFYSNIFNPYASQQQFQIQPQPYNPQLGQYQHQAGQYQHQVGQYQQQPYPYNPYNNFHSNQYPNIYSQSPFYPGQYGSAGPYQNMPPYSPNPFYNLRNNNPSPLASNAQLPPDFQMQASNNKFGDTYYANLQAEKEPALSANSNRRQMGRQFNVPFAEYFPIVIKNPFQQMFQAFTSMVEYGPEADICRRNLNDDNSLLQKDEANRAENKSRSNKMDNITKPSFALKDKETNTEIVIQKLEETTKSANDEYYIEGLKIISGQTNNDKSEIKLDSKSREIDDTFLEEDKFFQPLRNQPSKDGSKNGIFIERLKVRKGGVAIAGPGGIATAGSGGTAIVGPNGFAYTQPNGVAIAGPGSRVISVDPKVNLSEYVYNLTRADGSTPRIGKVVAVGPVIYHDLGQN